MGEVNYVVKCRDLAPCLRLIFRTSGQWSPMDRDSEFAVCGPHHPRALLEGLHHFRYGCPPPRPQVVRRAPQPILGCHPLQCCHVSRCQVDHVDVVTDLKRPMGCEEEWESAPIPHLCRYMRMSVYPNACTSVRTKVFTNVYRHTDIHSYRHTYIHTYKHTDMHTYIHTKIHLL